MCNALSFDYCQDDPFTRRSSWPCWPLHWWGFSGKWGWGMRMRPSFHIYWPAPDKTPVHWFPYCSPRSHCGNWWEDENRRKSSKEELRSWSNSLAETREISGELRPQRRNISASFSLPKSNPKEIQRTETVISARLIKRALFRGYQHRSINKCGRSPFRQFWN